MDRRRVLEVPTWRVGEAQMRDNLEGGESDPAVDDCRAVINPALLFI